MCIRDSTIANNIRFGKPDASMEEVKAAAKKARCYNFIMALPDGFDTVIGEGGATLSGGERQRISIARAIMKDAPIIILDEATANVDPENEKELMEAVAELTQLYHFQNDTWMCIGVKALFKLNPSIKSFVKCCSIDVYKRQVLR